MNLTCEPKWRIGLLGSAFFFGWCLTLLWVPRLADIYGRKKLFVIGMIGDLVVFTIVMVSKSLNVMIVMIFCFGALTSIRKAVGFIYLMDMTPQKG